MSKSAAIFKPKKKTDCCSRTQVHKTTSVQESLSAKDIETIPPALFAWYCPTVRHCLLAVKWALRQVSLDQQQLPCKKFKNKHLSNSIDQQVYVKSIFKPITFVSFFIKKGQMPNFHWHDKLTVNGWRKITWLLIYVWNGSIYIQWPQGIGVLTFKCNSGQVAQGISTWFFCWLKPCLLTIDFKKFILKYVLRSSLDKHLKFIILKFCCFFLCSTKSVANDFYT